MMEADERSSFNEKLRAEADALLSNVVFQRSPTLSKLLRYLVDETIAGRAETLKSFVIAVEGLGKSGDFDPGSDSSARVQMVRLRRTLEMHYAENAPVNGLCLYLQQGSYAARLGKPAEAYPMLNRRISDEEMLDEDIAPVTGQNEKMSRVSSGKPIPFYRRYRFVIAGALVSAIAGAFLLFSWQQRDGKIPSLSPILEIMPIDSGGQPELQPVARLIAGTFADNLPRFKISRVRVIKSDKDIRPPDESASIYRLHSRLVEDDDNNTILYLNVDDSRTNTLLWSREVLLPPGNRAASDALVPILHEISGPMGIIATYGTVLTRNSDEGGYPCLLKYFEFVRIRSDAIEDKVAACFEKPVKEQGIVATILASRALFALEKRDAAANFDEAATRGLAFARQAVAADPNDGSANFALARYSYLKRDCVSARYYTTRVLETNPNSPMFTATLAALAKTCDYPDAEKLLDQAFLTQSPQFAKGRILLILAALGQDRPDKIAEIADSDVPDTRYNRVNYYLSETLIAASQGRRADAIRYWALFSETIPPGSVTTDEKLRRIVALPAMRMKLTAFLKKAGVVTN